MKKLLIFALVAALLVPAFALSEWDKTMGAPPWVKEQAARTDLDRQNGFVDETRQAHGAAKGDALIEALPPQKGAVELPVVRFAVSPGLSELHALIAELCALTGYREWSLIESEGRYEIYFGASYNVGFESAEAAYAWFVALIYDDDPWYGMPLDERIAYIIAYIEEGIEFFS